EGRSVLELGCGTGELLEALKPSRGVGIDFSGGMLEEARRKFPHLEFRQMDIDTLETWEETFDIIVLSDVIGHLQDIETVLKRIKHFCRPDTRIVISYYNFLWEPVLRLGELLKLKMPQKQQNWLSPEDICNLLFLSGYQTIKAENRLLLPKNVPGLSRLINKYLAFLPGINRLTLCRYIVARPIGQRDGKEYSVSILVPCRNEKGNVEEAVKRIPNFGRHQEILFVEGGSSDGTREEIERVRRQYADRDIRLLIQDGKGKGDAVRKGFAGAKGEVLMILDADLTMPPEDLPKFYRALADDLGEFINGCRLVYPMEKQAMRFLNLLGNKFFSMMFTWILHQRFKDTLCGTKVLFKTDYEKIRAQRHYFGDFDPFGDFDLILGAVRLNLKVVEIPIRYRDRLYGTTNIQRFRHGWLLLKMTLFAFRKIKAV
ncbi:MAG: glycosyltransferase, partial [Desulfobacteraceae bacterium]